MLLDYILARHENLLCFFKGEFGVVYQAKLMRGFDNDVCDLVAVKTLRGTSLYLAAVRELLYYYYY